MPNEKITILEKTRAKYSIKGFLNALEKDAKSMFDFYSKIARTRKTNDEYVKLVGAIKHVVAAFDKHRGDFVIRVAGSAHKLGSDADLDRDTITYEKRITMLRFDAIEGDLNRKLRVLHKSIVQELNQTISDVVYERKKAQ